MRTFVVYRALMLVLKWKTSSAIIIAAQNSPTHDIDIDGSASKENLPNTTRVPRNRRYDDEDHSCGKKFRWHFCMDFAISNLGRWSLRRHRPLGERFSWLWSTEESIRASRWKSYLELEVPNYYQGVRKSPGTEQWFEATKEELAAFEKKSTWTMLKGSPRQKMIGTKWVFSIKKNGKGEIQCYVARLIALGYPQTHDVDYLLRHTLLLRILIQFVYSWLCAVTDSTTCSNMMWIPHFLMVLWKKTCSFSHRKGYRINRATIASRTVVYMA